MNRHTLHELPDGSGVVVQWVGRTPVSAQAGFDEVDIIEAKSEIAQDGTAHLHEWQHLTLTEESAGFVASTYPIIHEEEY